jgi:hypothetical protein
MDESKCETVLLKGAWLVGKLAMLDVSLCEVGMCLALFEDVGMVRWGRLVMFFGFG